MPSISFVCYILFLFCTLHSAASLERKCMHVWMITCCSLINIYLREGEILFKNWAVINVSAIKINVGIIKPPNFCKVCYISWERLVRTVWTLPLTIELHNFSLIYFEIFFFMRIFVIQGDKLGIQRYIYMKILERSNLNILISVLFPYRISCIRKST